MASLYKPGSSYSSVQTGNRQAPPIGPMSYERPLYSRPPPPPHTWPSERAMGSSSSPDRYVPDTTQSRVRSDSWNSRSDSHWESGPSGRRDPPTSTPRYFEPNDSWKKTHDDRRVQRSPNRPRYPPEGPRISPSRARSNSLRQTSDRFYRPAPSAPETLPSVRYNSYRPARDDRSSSRASSRGPSSTARRRSSPIPRGRQRSRSRSPVHRSYSSSRSSSRHRSLSRSRRRSSDLRRPSPKTSRLPRSLSPRPYTRRRTPSRSRSASRSRLRRGSNSRYSGVNRSVSRGRSRSRSIRRASRSPDYKSAPLSRSDSIASSRASPSPPPVPIIKAPIKAPLSKAPSPERKPSPVAVVSATLPEKVQDPAVIEQQPTPPLDEEVAASATPADTISTGIVDDVTMASPLASSDSVETIQADGISIAAVVVKQEEQVVDSLVSDEVETVTATLTSELDTFATSEPMVLQSPEEIDVVTTDLVRNDMDFYTMETSTTILQQLTRPPTPTDGGYSMDEFTMVPAQSLEDALRVTVMTRILCDRQTRDERVDPIIQSNLALVQPPNFRPSTSPETLLTEVLEGPRAVEMCAAFSANTQKALVQRFGNQQSARTLKAQTLRDEYLDLNEQWKTHCQLLESHTKATPILDGDFMVSGRATRRTATLGDMVRSDLEMEQIIASLGNDEASDPAFLSIRNHATLPDMVSVERGKVDYVYDDANLRVENPSHYYRVQTGMDDWTPEEEAIYLHRFAEHPKQFGIIAEGLAHKTAAQCVAFYYLHKKRNINFREVIATHAPKRKRRRTGKQKANALLTDIRQHDAEVSRDNEHTGTGRAKRKVPARRTGLEDTPTATPTPEPDGGRPKRRRATAARSGLAEEIDEDDIEDKPAAKRAKKTRKPKSSAVVDEGTLEQTDTLRRKPPVAASQWSDDDRQLFLSLLERHGTDFKRIAAEMPRQTMSQVTNFYNANRDKMGLQEVASRASAANHIVPPPGYPVPMTHPHPHPEFIPYMLPPTGPPMYPMPHMYAPHPGMYMPPYGYPHPPYYVLPPPSNEQANGRTSNIVPTNAS